MAIRQGMRSTISYVACGQECCYDGYIHPDGNEQVSELESSGRQVRACAIAAEITLPTGQTLIAVSTHGAWTAKANEGIVYPHQERYFEQLASFLEELGQRGRPMII